VDGILMANFSRADSHIDVFIDGEWYRSIYRVADAGFSPDRAAELLQRELVSAWRTEVATQSYSSHWRWYQRVFSSGKHALIGRAWALDDSSGVRDFAALGWLHVREKFMGAFERWTRKGVRSPFSPHLPPFW
jgi:hypothetical protein